MANKHYITKNILDATPVILGAPSAGLMVSFAYGTLPKALARTSGHDGEIEFGYDEETGGGQILVGGTPVTSKILDVDAVQKSGTGVKTGVKTVTVTYIDSAQTSGKATKTFEVVDETAVKSYIQDLSTALIGTSSDSSALDTINAAKNYAKAAGWTIAYDSTNKKIQLKEQGGSTISEIDATDFIKDGMLDSAALVTTKPASDNADYTGDGPWIVLVWNTDAEKTRTVINVDTLVDTYTSGKAEQLTISNYVITPVTADPSTAATTSEALATAGQVKSYVEYMVSEKNVTAEGETGNTALVVANAANNNVSVGSTEKLKTAVALAETAVQNVTQGTSTDTYINLNVGTKSNSSVIEITVNDGDLVTKITDIDGSLGRINTSIGHINSSIATINTSVNALEDAINAGVTASGDTLVSAAQDGTDKMKINVAATTDLTQAVGNANSAVHDGAVGTNATNILSNTKNASTLTVDFANAPINASSNIESLSAGDGTTTLVTARAVKDYVDSKTSSLNWIIL